MEQSTCTTPTPESLQNPIGNVFVVPWKAIQDHHPFLKSDFFGFVQCVLFRREGSEFLIVRNIQHHPTLIAFEDFVESVGDLEGGILGPELFHCELQGREDPLLPNLKRWWEKLEQQ